jgi:hypothetical protein
VSLDVPRLEAAIRRDDAAAVRDVLRDATVAERMTARKALKELFIRPAWDDLPFIRPAWDDLPFLMLRPADLAGLISSGFRVPPAAGHAHAGREHAEREREYEKWREITNGLAFPPGHPGAGRRCRGGSAGRPGVPHLRPRARFRDRPGCRGPG